MSVFVERENQEEKIAATVSSHHCKLPICGRVGGLLLSLLLCPPPFHSRD